MDVVVLVASEISAKYKKTLLAVRSFLPQCTHASGFEQECWTVFQRLACPTLGESRRIWPWATIRTSPGADVPLDLSMTGLCHFSRISLISLSRRSLTSPGLLYLLLAVDAGIRPPREAQAGSRSKYSKRTPLTRHRGIHSFQMSQCSGEPLFLSELSYLGTRDAFL